MLYDLLPLSGATVSLFETDTRRLDAARAVDALNQKYGRGSLSLASVVPVRNTAEDKIAFGKIAEM